MQNPLDDLQLTAKEVCENDLVQGYIQKSRKSYNDGIIMVLQVKFVWIVVQIFKIF